MKIDIPYSIHYDQTMRYVPGDRVFIIENCSRIREAEVIRYASGFCTIRFRNGGGTRLRESRFYKTIAEAEAEIARNKKSPSHGEGRMDWLG